MFFTVCPALFVASAVSPLLMTKLQRACDGVNADILFCNAIKKYG